MHILNKRASTFPLTATSSEPNPSPHHHHHPHQYYQYNHHQQLYHPTEISSATLPRASSEHGFSAATTTSTNTSCTPRTSCSDEAQACFNLLLILRADTQHLISLRNDNLDALERTAPARPLLQSINDALAAAAQSIAELGPFLERHRWPISPTSTTKIGGGGHHDDDTSHQTRPLVLYSIKPGFLLRRIKGPRSTTATTTTPPMKRRRRRKSFSNPPYPSTAIVPGTAGTATAPSWEEEAGWLSPEGLFSWTLALTAQHTAALVALDRLERFLAYGVAALREGGEEEEEEKQEARHTAGTEEERKREEAARNRDSWWDQQRGEFENVELIQSLLTGPRRRRMGEGVGQGAAILSTTPNEAVAATAAPVAAKDEACGVVVVAAASDDGTTSDLPFISEQQDDERSMTLVSEPPSELSMFSTPTPPWGLTARPRIPPKDAVPPNEEESIRARRGMAEPMSYSSPRAHPQQEPPPHQQSSRSETFGQPHDAANLSSSPSTTVPLSRYNSLKQRPRIATQPLPPLVGLSTLLLPERLAPTGVAGGSSSIHNTIPFTTTTNNNNYYLLPAAANASPSSALSATMPLLSPLLTPSAGGPQATTPTSPSPSPAVETPYTPYTPLDQQLATLFAQNALPSKKIQPVLRELQDDMVVSPVGSQKVHMVAVFDEHVSPITATTMTTVSGGAGGNNNSNYNNNNHLPSSRKGSLVSPSTSSSSQKVVPRVRRKAVPSPPHDNHHSDRKQQQQQREDNGDDDRHWPYLAYMARKQAVATSRWSLRRSRPTDK